MKGSKTKKEIEKYIQYYKTPFGKKLADYEAKLIDSYTPPNATLISIGCGPAIIESVLYQSRKDVCFVTLDNNKNIIRFADLHLNPLQADATQLPLFSNIADIVISITSLEFMQHPEKALIEAYRILKPKGLFVAFLLNPQSSYIKQKMQERSSYIGKNIQQKNYDLISSTVSGYFKQVEYHFNIFIKENEIKKRMSKNKARLVIMKGKK